MKIRKLVDALGFKDQYFKLFLRKRYCINISKFHNQILRPLVFPGVTINFQVAGSLIESLLLGLEVGCYSESKNYLHSW